jgi:lysophospholipase L1-like esterase
VRLRTTDTTLTLGVRQDYGAGEVALAVYVDGVYSQAVSVTADSTVRTATIALPAGDKLVEIYESVGLFVGSPLTGTWLSLVGGYDLRPDPVAPARRLALYGDSIVIGQAASAYAQLGLVGLLRGDYPGRLTVEAYRGRRLSNEPSVPGLAALLVQLLFDATTRDMWLAIGTNDYTVSTPLATFASKYAQLVDAVLAADATVRVFCQSPLLRTDGAETNANGVGAVLGDYRSQISAVCASRPRTTYVDGHGLITAGNLSDGLHPSDAGFIAYKAAVKAALGYP